MDREGLIRVTGDGGRGTGERKSLAGLGARGNYRKLDIWHKAFSLTIAVYKLTEGFPGQDYHGLTAHLRKSAVSVPSNIAEGYMRQHKAEYVQFVAIALGSLAELQTQLLLAKELLRVDDEAVVSLLEDSEHLTAMMIRLLRGLGRASRPGTPSPVTRHPSPAADRAAASPVGDAHA